MVESDFVVKKSTYKNITGQQIRLTRLSQAPALSQADLAKCANRRGVTLDQWTISRIENRTRNVSDYELLAIAKCLGVTVDQLFARNR